MEDLIKSAELCFDDVQCQGRALVYAAYKIDDEEVRKQLLYILTEKLQQLDRLSAASLPVFIRGPY